MKQSTRRLDVPTRGKGLYEISDQVVAWVRETGFKTGLLTVFIQHTSAGTRNGLKGGATFQFDWTPPATNAGPVTLFVAGNAANGNGSPTGDLIYTSSVQLSPAIPAVPSVTAGNIVNAATSAAGPVAPLSA